MARPRFKPSAADAKTVQTLSAYGIPEEQIATSIGPRGISPKTLRKYFRRELATGMMKANAAVGQTLFQMATSGQCPAATIFWTKTHRNERGWGPSVAPSEVVEESNDEFERRITAELARVAAARSAADVPGKDE
jgi:hypothetical protein